MPPVFVNGHDTESRASTQATATSLDPERLSHDHTSREVRNALLELPSTSQTRNRYSVTSFNQQIDEIQTGGANNLPLHSEEESSVPERRSNEKRYLIRFPVANSSVARISTESTRGGGSEPDRRTTNPFNGSSSTTRPLQQPNLDPNDNPNPQPPTTNDSPPTTDRRQNPPAESAVPQLTHVPTTTNPVHTSHPNPTQPSSLTGDPIPKPKRDRHHRRFVRWVKKRFRRQSPWSTDSPHDQTEAVRVVSQARGQGL